MEDLLAVILGFAEIILQLLLELTVESTNYSLMDNKNPVKKTAHPVLSIIIYSLLGVFAGVISLLIMPTSFVSNYYLRIASLIFTPIAIGGIMVCVGKLRVKKGQNTTQLDTFSYAFCFAFTMSLVRFIWAK